MNENLSGRVLVIEDEPHMNAITSFVLEHEGHQVVSALNLTDAYAMIDEGYFDVIVLDNLLPGESGIDSIPEIHRRSNAKIVMITGTAAEEVRPRAISLGADDFLPKPFAPVELVQTVGSLIEARTD